MEKHSWQPQLPYGGCVGIFCCSEDSYDLDQYWLIVKCHSGRVGRQLYNKFFKNNSHVTVKDFKNSAEYLGAKSYSRQLSRALLMNALTKLGLNDQMDHDLSDSLESMSLKDDTPNNISTTRPHFDITFNDFNGVNFYNECYNSNNVLGSQLLFFADTLHNGYMFKKDQNTNDVIIPCHGNFYADDAQMKLSPKHLKKIEDKDYIFVHDYPCLKPFTCQNPLQLTNTAFKKLKKSIPEDCWDDKQNILPIISVYH